LEILAIDPASAQAGTRIELEKTIRAGRPPTLSHWRGSLQCRCGKAPGPGGQELREARRRSSVFCACHRALALLYGQRPADAAKAFDFATKARQAYPDDPDVAKTLGILSFRRELYREPPNSLKQAFDGRK